MRAAFPQLEAVLAGDDFQRQRQAAQLYPEDAPVQRPAEPGCLPGVGDAPVQDDTAIGGERVAEEDVGRD